MLKNDRNQTAVNEMINVYRKLLGGEGDPSSPLLQELMGMVDDHQVDQGENLLFERLEDGDPEALRAGLSFYHRLNTYDDKTLKAMNFSRTEIKAGVEDMMKHFGWEVED